MKDWWKDPRLQGPENDYGDYDYLIEELPNDHCEWELQKYTEKCDSCGKESHLVFRATHYFYCWDGWDSMTYTECWRCMLKGKICSFKNKITRNIKKKIEVIKLTKEIYDISPNWTWKKSYECALKIKK